MSATFSYGMVLVALAVLFGCTANTAKPTTPPKTVASTPDGTSSNQSNDPAVPRVAVGDLASGLY